MVGGQPARSSLCRITPRKDNKHVRDKETPPAHPQTKPNLAKPSQAKLSQARKGGTNPEDLFEQVPLQAVLVRLPNKPPGQRRTQPAPERVLRRLNTKQEHTQASNRIARDERSEERILDLSNETIVGLAGEERRKTTPLQSTRQVKA